MASKPTKFTKPTNPKSKNRAKPKNASGSHAGHSKPKAASRPHAENSKPKNGSGPPAAQAKPKMVPVEDMHRTLYLMAKTKILQSDRDVPDPSELKERCHPERIVEEIVSVVQGMEDTALEEADTEMEEADGEHELDTLAHLVDHIRSEANIFNESPEIEEGIKEIVRDSGLDLADINLYDLIDGDKDPRVDRLIEQAAEKFGDEDYISDDSMYKGGPPIEVVEEILRESCGFLDCKSNEVTTAIKNAAKQVDFDNFDENSENYQKLVSDLRQKFKSFPGVLPDQDLERQTLRQNVYEKIAAASDLLAHEDVDRIDAIMNPIVDNLLEAVKYDGSKIAPGDIEDAAALLKKRFDAE